MKKFAILLIALVLAFSCSTNKPSVSNIDLPPVEDQKPVMIPSSPDVVDVMAPAERYKLSERIQQFSSHAKRAEKFFAVVGSIKSTEVPQNFAFTTDTFDIIASKIRASGGEIVVSVDTYRPVYRFSKVTAYQSGNGIFFNIYKLNRSDCSIINTFVHEYLHKLGYSHGDNSPAGKGASVPYFVGDMAEEACEKGQI